MIRAITAAIFASTVAHAQSLTPQGHDLACMTEAIYFEARGETEEGQRAVAEVILNRVASPRFPDTVCAVVKQRWQFSYRLNPDLHLGNLSPSDPALQRAYAIAAEYVWHGERTEYTDAADHYLTASLHQSESAPSWANPDAETVQIGAHQFLRLY